MAQQIDIIANLQMKVDGAEAGVKKLQNSLNGLKLPAKLDADFKKSFSGLEGLFAKFKSQIEGGFKTKGDVSALTKTAKQIDVEVDRITRNMTKINGQEIKFKVDSSELKDATKQLESYISDREKLIEKTQNEMKSGLDQLRSAGSRSTRAKDSINMLETSLGRGDMKQALADLNELESRMNKLQSAKGKIPTGLFDALRQSIQQAEGEMSTLDGKIEGTSNEMERLKAVELNNIIGQLNQIASGWDEDSAAIKRATGEVQEYARASQSMTQQLGDLKNTTQYFFSLRNMINLLKRGIDEAIDSVKELDAAMTETAVVTDFSVGDMWEKLPEYTANANALGASVKDMYEATTLYYQQGLNTEQSMSIAAETMKMARIGGLEAADATDKMTAALRGFNMEINETSAQRVNDVYSNLAAKTASNTEELGTAMQRTASIAASAGMSFEGTAAFLAQAIETTREPAENLGTAMKTIVARFTELKKNPLEISEVDGEEVDYNKIDTALKSIGVSLKDTNGQFRNLDQVFLDISEKWDSLSQTQQRYVATTAAGSRQQSRFIAMMSNYERTVQLMDYANNSAGASNEQFGKTMESLEAKLNKLHNAWQQFEMGIADNTIIKGAVDGLTNLLGTVNTLLNTLSFGSSGIKSLLSIFTAFAGLKMAGRLANSVIGGLGGMLDPTSSFSKGFFSSGKGAGTEGGIAGKISNPIVAKLGEVIAAIKGQKTVDKGQVSSTIGQYKDAVAMLRNPKSLNVGDINALFSNLSDEHAYSAYRNTPGTANALQQSALGWLNGRSLTVSGQKTGQQLMSAIFKGMQKKEISIKDGTKLLGNPQLWGKYFGTDVAQNFSKEFLNDSKKLTQRAVDKTWSDLGMKLAASDTKKDYLNTKEGRAKFVEAFKQNRQDLIGSLDNTQINLTDYQQLANKIGVVGSRFSAAGLSIQMFGSQLSQLSPALQGVGSLLMQIGTAINVAGMGFSSIGNIATGIVSRFSTGVALAKATTVGVQATGGEIASNFIAGFTGGMSAGPIAAIITGVVLGGIMLAKSAIEKRAQKAGEEVRQSFEDGFTKNNEKLEALESYRDRFAELSKGVDQFGHNVNLSNDDYSEYLNISRELSQLSPSLITGYNAEGEAILKKGDALDEVIDKLKEEKQAALDSYITDSSINKLIGEFKTSDAYKDNNRQADSKGEGRVKRAFQSEIDELAKASSKAKLDFGVEDAIAQLGGGTVENLSQLTTDQLLFVSQHYNDILNLLDEKNGQLDDKVKDGFKEAFGNISGAIDDVTSEGQPIIDAMQQWMGQEKLDAVGISLGEEFTTGFTQGFNTLMTKGLTEGWNSEKFKTAIRDYSNEWKKLGGSTSEYNRILERASEKQEDYLDHIGEKGAIEDYKSSIEDSAQKLEQLAEAQDKSTEAGRIFAQECIKQANALRNYATEGAMTLAEALNVLSSKFTEARNAKERFEQATSGGDYYTAAEGFRSIAETVLDEKNVAGDGSLTAWIGAEQLLGQQFIDTHSWDEIVSHLKTVNTLFDDGIEGVYNFNDMLVNAVNSGKDLSGLGKVVDGAFEFDFDNVENLKEYADTLGIAEDVLVGMIDKSRQFAAFNVGNNKQIRQALEQSEQAMIGQSYDKTTGKSNLYMAESAFRTEAYQQGIRGDDYTKTKEDLTKEQNVQFLTVDSLTAKDGSGLGLDKVLKDIGLEGTDKNLDNTVAALTKMGFDLEDQKKILTSDGLKLADGPATAEDIEKAYQEQEFATENPTVAGIANDTGVIASAATAMLAQMGILTDQTKKDIENSTSKDTLKGYNDLLNPEGGFKDSGSRSAAREQVQVQIDKYNETLSLLESSSNKEALQPYIDQLTTAKTQLEQSLNNEATSWEKKLSNASDLVKDIGNATEQAFLQEHAIDVQSIFNQDNLVDAATQLRALKEEGNLTRDTMIQLGNALIEQNWDAFSQLNNADFDAFLTKIGFTSEEIRQIRAELSTPFSFNLQESGISLEQYISEIDSLTATDKSILLNANISGAEKVTQFIDQIDAEFGDGSQETKTVILEAEAKMAAGDQLGAEQLLKDAGFSEQDVKTITQKLSITVDGSIANKGEVQEALNSEVSAMKLKYDGEIELKAKVNIDKQALSKTTGSMNVSSKVDSSAINQAKSNAQAGATMPIKAKDEASSTINTIKSKARQSVSFNVSPNFTGTWTKTLTITTNRTNGNARGRLNKIPVSHIPSFGSAAGGYNGSTSGSKRKIDSLVGEKGFEIGYIPSEQRSVIFGANGPEMTSFPSDTIIYTHEQSKDIIRRGKKKQPEYESHVSGKLPTRNGGGGTSSSRSSSSKSSGGKSKAEKEVIDASKILTNAVVWWENILRRTEATQRKADQNQKTYEKYLKKIQATLNKTGTEGEGNAFISNLNKVISLNNEQVKRATTELNNLDFGTTAQRNAKTKSAKATATKNAYMNEVGGAVKISYKSGKETKEKLVNTAGYIKAQDGTYVIDQAALNKVSDREERKALKDALEKEINDRISKKNKAEDEIQKAQEALEKFAEELYETFFAWENELTKIWNITQKIEASEKNIARSKQYTDLLNTQIASGMQKATEEFAGIINQSFNTEIQQQVKAIQARSEEIKANQEEIDKLLDTADEQRQLNSIRDKLNKSASIQAAYNDVQAKANKVTEARNASKTTSTVAIGNLVYGQKGDTIKKLQQALNKTMGANLNVNGVFDSATLSAVKQFQRKYKKKYGIAVDGVVGSATKKALSALGYNFNTQTVTNQNAGNLNTYIDQYQVALQRYQSLAKTGNVLSDTERLAYEKEVEQLSQELAAIEKAQSFMTTTKYEDGTIDVVFNTEDFERAKQEGNITSDMAKKIQDYVKSLIDTSNSLKEAYENLTSDLTDLYKTLDDLKDQWSSYSTELLNSVEKQQSKQLDRLKKLSDAISKALKKLYDEVKRKLDERRQQEDNTKTEKDIAQKQQRLAALRADTSGGNQVEIAKLEKEIADAQQNYQRTLEDQMLEKLQQEADKAAEQRERQITLQEGILEATNNAALINLWMSDPQAYRAEIEDAYRTANDYSNQPLARQEEIDRDFEALFSNLLINQQQQIEIEQAIKEVSDQLKQVEEASAKVGNVTQTTAGTPAISAAGATPAAAPIVDTTKQTTTAAKTTTTSTSSLKVSSISGNLKYGQRNNNIKTLQTVLNKLGYKGSNGKKLDVDGYFGSNTLYAVKQFQRKYSSKYGIAADGVVGPATKKAFKALGYKTGGLADYTGPAWLDGTPSKPELVLNAQDTKNFIALKDILSHAISLARSSSYTGDVSYEINVNVDKIEKDYDVDRMVERIKKQIVKDASYRNVTQVRNLR